MKSGKSKDILFIPRWKIDKSVDTSLAFVDVLTNS